MLDSIISNGDTGAAIGALVGSKKVGVQTGGCAQRAYSTEAGPQKTTLVALGLYYHPHSEPHYSIEENISRADATIHFSKSTINPSHHITSQNY